MTGRDAALVAAFEHGMAGDQLAGLVDLDLVGERLMIGLPGPDLRDEDVTLFRDTRAAGLILYRRNFSSPAQLLDVLGRLESALGRRLLVATDHEGGRIVMLGRGVTIFPDNLAVGTAGEETFAFKQGLYEARELRRLGVDLNLGPCVDVLTERYSPNIGIRAYGKDPALVARYGVARIRGMVKGGLSACPKHFPGKGHSPLDAHLRLPTIDSDWGEMHRVHLVPFLEAIAAGVDCVMTSHPVYPKLDPSGVPATFSRLIVEDYLRGVVPAEMPTSWPLEARRAQAIAARSYAAYRLRPGVSTFDVYDDTRSQVYQGARRESAASDAAVTATAAQVLRSGSAIANALFAAGTPQ